MTGPLDPENAYWNLLKRSPAYTPAWNAALWEAHKIVRSLPESQERDEALEDLMALARER